MIQKSYYGSGNQCRVTFRYTPDREVSSVNLVSELDDWDQSARPLTRRKDGSYSVSIVMRPGSRYRFRYLIDGDQWENDDQADAYVQNDFGGTDSVVEV